VRRQPAYAVNVAGLTGAFIVKKAVQPVGSQLRTSKSILVLSSDTYSHQQYHHAGSCGL